MAFFYDNISGLSGLAQYDRYLENNLYIRNLKRYTNDPLNYQLLEMKRTIGENTSASIDNTNRLSNETQKYFEHLTTAVCGTLEKGFGQVVGELEDINWRLNDINEGINSLHSMLDWKTDIMIEEQKISNLYLGKVAGLLKIPDSQKQRSHHVELGITWLKNAIEEGPKSDFYTDALDEFIKAKQIEEKDYFNLNKIGLIHLHSKKHLDVPKADEYFKASARYAKAIANATPSTNESLQNRYNERLESLLTKEVLLEEAASSLNYASRCNYILTNFSEAIELAKQAFELQPTNPEYGLQLAKCLSANNQETEAANILSRVIEIDKYYSMKALADQDFISKSLIRDRIEKIATDLINKVSSEIRELKSLIIDNSNAKDLFSKVQESFHDQTYLNARVANDELTKIQKWEYTHYSQDAEHYYPLEDKKVDELTLSEIIRVENKEQANKNKFDENYNIANAIRQSNWKKQSDERTIRQIIVTLVTFGAAIGLWIWSSSMDGWLPGFLVKGAVAVAAGFAVTKLYDSVSEEKTKNLLLTTVIVGTAIGAWLACTDYTESSFWSFILKAQIVGYTAFSIFKVYDAFD